MIIGQPTIGLRNPARGYDYRRWEGLDRKIVPIDVDGLLEVKGNFLIFEYKIGLEAVSEGQIRSLRAMSVDPKFTVFVVRNAGEFNPLMNAYDVIPDGYAQVTPDLARFEVREVNGKRKFFPLYKDTTLSDFLEKVNSWIRKNSC